MPFPYTFPFTIPAGSDSGVTPVVPELEHGAAALNRLAQYLRERPSVQALIEAVCAQAQDLETAFQQLGSDRTLEAAFGGVLDVLGTIVGEARQGLDDDTYRERIRARIKLNESAGTVGQILEIFALLQPDQILHLRDEHPAAFSLTLDGGPITADDASLLAGFLREARAAGVRGILIWAEDPELFEFDSADSGFDDSDLALGGAV